MTDPTYIVPLRLTLAEAYTLKSLLDYASNGFRQRGIEHAQILPESPLVAVYEKQAAESAAFADAVMNAIADTNTWEEVA